MGRRISGRRWAAAILAAVVALATGCAGGEGGDAGPGQRLWVNPDNTAVAGAAALDAAGRGDEAALVRGRIATKSTARWFAADYPALEVDVRGVVTRARDAGAVPVLVTYFIPSRDCGGYSGGGAGSADQYRGWIERLAAGIGRERAIVVLEPDALPHTVQDCATVAGERYALLNFAVDRLTALPGTRVYLDAGNASWIRDAAVMAEALEDAGVRRVDGFALNTANFVSTPDTVAYGRAVSDRIGEMPFVIDTSRNGNGALGEDRESWCNPPGRALGEEPTLDTGLERVDAFLWVKQPGDSDGQCRGGPPAGTWWPQGAVDLVGAG